MKLPVVVLLALAVAGALLPPGTSAAEPQHTVALAMGMRACQATPITPGVYPAQTFFDNVFPHFHFYEVRSPDGLDIRTVSISALTPDVDLVVFGPDCTNFHRLCESNRDGTEADVCTGLSGTHLRVLAYSYHDPKPVFTLQVLVT